MFWWLEILGLVQGWPADTKGTPEDGFAKPQPPKQVNLGHLLPMKYFNWHSLFPAFMLYIGFILLPYWLKTHRFYPGFLWVLLQQYNQNFYSVPPSSMLTQHYFQMKIKLSEPQKENSRRHLTAFVNGEGANHIIRNIYISLAKPKGFSFITFDQCCLPFFLNKKVGTD